MTDGPLTFPLSTSIVFTFFTLPFYTVDELPLAVSHTAWALIGGADTRAESGTNDAPDTWGSGTDYKPRYLSKGEHGVVPPMLVLTA